MNQWWGNLNTRERLILLVAGLIGIIIVLDSLVIEEYRVKNETLDEQIALAKDDLEWMREAVQRLPDTKPGNTKIIAGRVVSFIDQQINRMGLKQQMQQMTPIQDHSVRVKLTEVEFGKLLNFFNAIEGAVIIEEVRLIPSEQKGFVDVSLVVRNASGS
jgi:type II secretory pathway component PulM